MNRYQITIANKRNRVQSSLRDLYSRAAIYHLTEESLRKSLVAIWECSDYKTLPAYHKGYLDGLQRALSDHLWRYVLTNALFDASGNRLEHSPSGPEWLFLRSGVVYKDSPDILFMPIER